MTDLEALNAFESDKPGTIARDEAEVSVQHLRHEGGLFVEAVRATRMAMALADPSLPGNPIVFANQAFLELSGYSMEEVLGQQPYFMNGAETDPQDAEDFRRALAEDRDTFIESVQYRKDGSRFVASLFLSAFKDDDGRTLYHFLSWYDVTDRVDAEDRVLALRKRQAGLRESEERHAFLLKLSDTLRAEPNAEAVATRALHMLFEQMGLDRCYVGVYRLEEDKGEFPHQVHSAGLPPMPAQVRLSDFPKALEVAFDRTLVIDNVAEMEGLSDQDRANLDALRMGALIASTLRKGENNPHWSIVVGSAQPRAWTQSEVFLVDQVTERTWAAIERARADTALRDSEDRYRTLFEAIDSGFCILEMIFDENGRAADYRFVEANPAFERQSGLVGALGRRIREFAPDLEAHWLERYGRVALTGESMRIEGEVAPLGRWFDINAFRVGAPEQRRVAVLFTDISARKQIETALQTSKQQFETLLNQAPLGVYLVNSDFVIQHVNPIAAPVFGDMPGGPVGRDFDEVIHVLWDKDYADEVVGIFRRVLETGEPFVTPERAEHRSDRDTVEYYEWRLDRIILQDGRYGVVCYFRDISAQVHARKEIEKAREQAVENEERQGFLLKLSDTLRPMRDPADVQAATMRLVAEHLDVVRASYFAVDPDEDGLTLAASYERGVDPLPATKMRISDFAPDMADGYRNGRTLIIEDSETEAPSEAERAAYRAIGVRAGVGVPLVKDGRLLGVFGVHSASPRKWTSDQIQLLEDVADRIWAAVEQARSALALRNSESRLRAMFDSVDQGFMEVEVEMSPEGRAIDWRYVAINPSFHRLTGMEDVTGRLASEVFPDREPEWAERYAQVVTTGEPIRFELPAAAFGRWFDINLVNVDGPGNRRIAVVYDDVTERKRAEAVLLENEARQAFLLKLSDALRAEPSAEAVADRAVKMLFEQMRLDRCFIGTFHLEEDRAGYHHQVHHDHLPPLPAEVRISDFPEAFEVLLNGSLVIDNIAVKEGFSDDERANIEALGLRALIDVTLRKGEKNPLWAIIAGSMHPRVWTSGEISLVEEVAERTWAAVERAHAEKELLDSEARLAAAFESVPVGVAVIDTNGAAIVSNEEYRRFLPKGVMPSRDPERFSRWKAWGPGGELLEPKDYPSARALRGESVVPGLEMLFTTDDGREIWTSVSTVPTFDEANRVTGAVAVISDIDTAKRGVDVLRESEERFRTLAEAIEDVFYITDLDANRLIYLSPAYESVWGRPVAELESNLDGFIDTIHPDDRAAFFPAKTAQSRGENVTTEYRIVRPDGTVRWILDRSFPIGDRSARRSAGVATDVTERRMAEDALRANEERLRLIVESARDYAIFTTDCDDIITDWLPGAQAVFGYSKEEAEGQPASILYTHEDRAAAQPATEIETALREGKAPDVRWHLRKGGRRVFIEGQVVPLRNGNGDVDGYLKIGQDVTGRQLAEEAVRESEARFRQFGEASSDLLWIRNAESLAFEYLSPAFEALYGTPREAVLEANNVKAWAELIHPDDQPLAIDLLKKLREGVPATSEFRIIRPADGEIRWIHDSSFPMFDERGVVERIAGIGQDITERRRAVELQGTLLAELQHRVRNILALIQSVVRRTTETSASPEEYARHLGGRIAAMARTQAMLTRSPTRSIDLEEVLRDELLSVAASDKQHWCEGPRVLLPPKAAEVFTLAIHELATNSVKYGALSGPRGQLEINWRTETRGEQEWLVFEWEETRVRHSGFLRQGFGTELITGRVPYELRGAGSMEPTDDGMIARLEFPIVGSSSILETTVPEQLR